MNLLLTLDLTGKNPLEDNQMAKARIPTPTVHPSSPITLPVPLPFCMFLLSACGTLLKVDFGDDARSVATARSVVTTRTDKTIGTTTTARTKKTKDVPPVYPDYF